MQAIDVKLPRPRSQLPILSDFTIPLPNTDQFYFSEELWDPLTRQPLKNQFGLKPAIKATTKKKTMPTTASKKKVVPLEQRSSQIDQLESETETAPTQEQKTVKRTTSKDKGKGKAKDKAKDKEITRIVKSTKPSTSKRKRSTSPSHSHSTEQEPEPKRTNSANRIKEKLERFRYNIKSDETPSSEIKADSSEPHERQRPPKSDSPPLEVADQVEQHQSEPPKKKKKRTQSQPEILKEPVPVPSHSPPRKQQKKKSAAEEVIFYMPEVDEDGNPISTSREPSLSPPHSLNNEISITPIQYRSPSPIRHSPTRQPLLSSPRKLNPSPFRPSPPQNPLPKPSPFRPALPNPRPIGDLPSFPSSSNSFDLPSEMAERIRNSGSSPERNELPEEDEVREKSSGRQRLSEEARRELEEVIEGFGDFDHEFAGLGEEGTLGLNEGESEKYEDRTLVDENEEEGSHEGAKDNIGDRFLQIP